MASVAAAAGSGSGRPLGILAGGGRFPSLVARAAEAAGRRVLVVGIAGEAEAGAERPPDAWVKRGQIGRLLALLSAAGASELVLIGAIAARRMPRLSEVDLRGLWIVLRHRRLLARGDDGVLRTLAAILEGEGVGIVGAAEVAPDLLARDGAFGQHRPGPVSEADIALGLDGARALGRRDLGQGVVASGGRVVAQEGRDGTDAMLRRLAETGEGRGGVLVKCAKPGQDRRLDLPAIGSETVARAASAGLAGIAVASGETLVADRERVAAAADRAGLFVVGVPSGDCVGPRE